MCRGPSEETKSVNENCEREVIQNNPPADSPKPIQNKCSQKIDIWIKPNPKYETPPKLKFSSQKVDSQKSILTSLGPLNPLKNTPPQKATLPCSAKAQPLSPKSAQNLQIPSQKVSLP